MLRDSIELRSDQKETDSIKLTLKNGDIILRTGNDAISSLFAQLNQNDKTFSHCGIAYCIDSVWYVFHSIGGEDNPDEKLRRDLFETFISRKHNLGFGVCRFQLNEPEIKSIQQVVYAFYEKAIPFDMRFDLTSDDRLYCAEMVYKAFQTGLNETHFFSTSRHRSFEYVSTDNIFLNNKATMLAHIVY